ncbi:hypothetical protein SAMN05421858_3265 [Haladaptatus litoreus]|uniref:Uncharacterized protein n=1 Tax=Haladaptatus litoreus TaxID=553468 RepID=A0A1N7CUK4_9EURY|nr:hypothetical protein SAMN05421858_3265 [Haladaptatus litoreus]
MTISFCLDDLNIPFKQISTIFNKKLYIFARCLLRLILDLTVPYSENFRSQGLETIVAEYSVAIVE